MKFPNITFEGFIKNTIYTFGSAFILYVLSLFAQPAINLLSSISQSFSHFYYRLIALNDSNQITLFIVGLVVILVLSFFVFVFTYISTLVNKLKDYQKLINKSESVDDKTEKDVTINRNSIFRVVAIAKTFAILFPVIFYLYYLLLMNVNTKCVLFENKLTFLAPYVENRTILLLKSDWSIMESKSFSKPNLYFQRRINAR